MGNNNGKKTRHENERSKHTKTHKDSGSEADEDDVDGVGPDIENFISDKEFIDAFKHQPKRDGKQEATATGPVINTDQEKDVKYEVFRLPKIKDMLEKQRIQIVDAVSYKKIINIFKATRNGQVLIIKMIDRKDMDPGRYSEHQNDNEFRMRMQHNRVIATEFIAADVEGRYDFIVQEYCERGSMWDMMHDNGPLAGQFEIERFAVGS